MKVRDFFILFVLPDRRWLGREVKTSLSVGVITVGMKNEMNLNEEQGVAHPRRRIYSESWLITHFSAFRYALITGSIGRNDADDHVDARVSIANIIIMSLYDTD